MAGSGFFTVHSEFGSGLLLGASSNKAVTVTPEAGDVALWSIAGGVLVNKSSGLALTGGFSESVTLAAPNGAWQQWEVRSDGSIGQSGNVLTVPGTGTSPGAAVQLQTPQGPGPNQRWRIIRGVVPAPAAQPRALVLNGTDASVSVAGSSLGTSDFTVEAWVRTTAAGPIVSVSVSTMEGRLLLATHANGSIRFAIAAKLGGMVIGDYEQITPPTGVLDGEWHHVAATRQGTTLAVYVDGVPAAVWPGKKTLDLESGTLYLGGGIEPPLIYPSDTLPLPSPYTLDGSLDEVRLWTRARTQAEIADGMHHAVDPADPDLWGAWSFDDDDARDLSVNGRNGTPLGACAFADSEIDVEPAGQPYIVTQSKLIQDWTGPLSIEETVSYRTVITLRDGDGSPLPGFVTLYGDDQTEAQFGDGTTATLGASGYVVPTGATGELIVTWDAQGALISPTFKLCADFMDVAERLVVFPDRQAHAAVGALTGNALRGLDANGQPLRDVTLGRKPVPLPEVTAAQADAVANVFGQVMATAVQHDVQGERPLTRAVTLPEDVPLTQPYAPAYQDPGLAPTGYDAASDVIAAHYLAADQDVVRILVTENAPDPHWSWHHADGTFKPLADADLAHALTAVQSLQYDDAYTKLLKVTPAVFLGTRTISVSSSTLLTTATTQLRSTRGIGDWLDDLDRAATVVVSTVKAVVTDVAQTVATLVVTFIDSAGHAWQRALQTVEDAIDFVGAVLQKAGGVLKDLLDFVKGLFAWEDFLLTQRVFVRYVVEVRDVLESILADGAKRAETSIDDFRQSLDQTFATWRSTLQPAAIATGQRRAATAPPSDVQSGYLTTNVSQNLGGANPPLDDPLAGFMFGDVASSLTSDLKSAFAAASATAIPQAQNAVGADPSALLSAGLDDLLTAVQLMIDTVLEAAAGVVKTLADALSELIDALWDIGTTRIDIPYVTDFVEIVVFDGGEELTLFALLTLAAAVPATLAYKVANHTDEPMFTVEQVEAFEALPSSAYTWLNTPWSAGQDVRAAAAGGADPVAIARLSSASPFLYAVGTVVWGATSVMSDATPSVTPHPKAVTYLGLGAQAFCFVFSYPWGYAWPDGPADADADAASAWAIQALPMLSNVVAARSPSGYGAKEDAFACGAYGCLDLGLSIMIWVEREQATNPDHAAAALEGVQNILGALEWLPQLLKLVPDPQPPQVREALVALDLISYGGVAILSTVRGVAALSK